jgi:hypothetical protein
MYGRSAEEGGFCEIKEIPVAKEQGIMSGTRNWKEEEWKENL